MAVHERRFVRRDFDLEHANVLVLEGLVMMGLSSDLDFVLSEGKGRQDENCQFRSGSHGSGLYSTDHLSSMRQLFSRSLLGTR